MALVCDPKTLEDNVFTLCLKYTKLHILVIMYLLMSYKTYLCSLHPPDSHCMLLVDLLLIGSHPQACCNCTLETEHKVQGGKW